jgi:hypothetical protein
MDDASTGGGRFSGARTARDFTRARGLRYDNLSFRGPIGAFTGAARLFAPLTGARQSPVTGTF